MIISFIDRDAQLLFLGKPSKRLPPDIQRTALRKMYQLHGATELNFLRVPPGNRLEALKGNRKGQYSIRINDQWRICFRWQEGKASVRNRRLPLLGGTMAKIDLSPVHPGEILLEDFMKPLGLSQYGLAKAIGVPPRRINEIVQGKRAITADTALRLGRYFGVDPQSWMNLQTHYELKKAEIDLGARLKAEVHPRAA